MTITFKNPGLIDMLAVTTMGVSVKNPGSFGYFGTGLKFSIATILRGGGNITIWRGKKAYGFRAKDTLIRGEMFQMIHMGGKSLGFTTQLGRNWEPWMVLRELGCNALDEGGRFTGAEELVPDEDSTTIVVSWPPLDQALAERGTIFAEGVIVGKGEKVQARGGDSEHMFYRSIRVSKLDGKSAFTWDILDPQQLTEDRTLMWPHVATRLVRDFVLTCEDPVFIRRVISPEEDTWESTRLMFAEEGAPAPSRAFIDAYLDAKEEGDKHVSIHARAAVSKERRRSDYTGGGGYARLRDDNLTSALAVLDALGFRGIDREIHVVELDNEKLTLVENGRLYVSPEIVHLGVRDIAIRVATGHMDAKGMTMAYEVVPFLLPMLLEQNRETRLDNQAEPQPEAPAQPKEEELAF